MNQETITKNRLAAGLASPDYCLILHKLGCTQRTAFVWLQKGTGYIPFTYEFDPDHYYAVADRVITEAMHHIMIPAYSTEEIKRVMEPFNYMLSKEGKVFQLQVAGMFNDTDFESQVYNTIEANAFAAILLDLLQKKILTLDYINACIRHD